MTPEQIQLEWDSFIDYSTAEKTFVTTTSALLFARHIADETSKDQAAEIESLRADAARYRWLRSQHWTDNTYAVIRRPKDNALLGTFLPSEDLLDEMLTEVMEATTKVAK